MIALILFILCLSLRAEEYGEIQYSLLTNHFSSMGSESFANAVDNNDKRLIKNKVYGFRYVKEEESSYKTHRFFGGEDSIGSPIHGYAFSKGVTDKTFYLGYIVGAYHYNQEKWTSTYSYRDDGKDTPAYIYRNEKWGIVGIIGVEIDFKIIEQESYYIKISNIITPFVTNHSLSLGFSF